ncbi:hypothetical protein PBRA_003737 [Plasmodiophora brassicae]|uniref:Uncharacterized protein n=1 Tax=Plasmodiophora brassicae TaxID=37360 RepID=A0A0G4IIC9_PLABS|nr:hypothetical protein PBRA_003737 [Plasmodiophora brassicae]
MHERDFDYVCSIWAMAGDISVTGWDGETLAEALAWCDLVDTPGSLDNAQVGRCNAIGLLTRGQTARTALLRRLLDNYFTPADLMASMISSYPDPAAFCDEFAEVAVAEASAEKRLRELNCHDSQTLQERAIARLLSEALQHCTSKARRRELIVRCSEDRITMQALLWNLSDGAIAMPEIADLVTSATLLDNAEFLARSCWESNEFRRQIVPGKHDAMWHLALECGVDVRGSNDDTAVVDLSMESE